MELTGPLVRVLIQELLSFCINECCMYPVFLKIIRLQYGDQVIPVGTDTSDVNLFQTLAKCFYGLLSAAAVCNNFCAVSKNDLNTNIRYLIPSKFYVRVVRAKLAGIKT